MDEVQGTRGAGWVEWSGGAGEGLGGGGALHLRGVSASTPAVARTRAVSFVDRLACTCTASCPLSTS